MRKNKKTQGKIKNVWKNKKNARKNAWGGVVNAGADTGFRKGGGGEGGLGNG